MKMYRGEVYSFLILSAVALIVISVLTTAIMKTANCNSFEELYNATPHYIYFEGCYLRFEDGTTTKVI